MTVTMIDEVSELTEEQFALLERARARTAPTEKAVLFSDLMVRALLAGIKTQTRRVVRNIVNVALQRCPFGQVGDRLWVRECWCQPDPGHPHDVLYRADVDETMLEVERDLRRECGPGSYVPWRPSIHMPRWAARIVLEITEVRLQHLWEMSESDVAAEGVEAYRGDMLLNGEAAIGFVAAPKRFQLIWDGNHHGRPGCLYRDNPLVWAITFRRLKP